MCDTCALADDLVTAAGALAYRRPLSAVEESYGDVPRVARDFDAAEEAVAKAGAPVVKRIVAQLSSEVAALVKAGDVAALSGVSASYVGELATALNAGVGTALRLGNKQITDAHRSQRGTRLAAKPPGKDPKKARDYLKARSTLGAQQVADGIRANIVRSASGLVMKPGTAGLSEDAIADLIAAETWAAAERTLIGTALELGREGVGVGRLLALQEVASDIAEVHYSAILDDRVCDPCAEADGRTWIADDGDDIEEGIASTPNDECEGTSARCRCVSIAVFRR
jgi:hypothetical protein